MGPRSRPRPSAPRSVAAPLAAALLAAVLAAVAPAPGGASPQAPADTTPRALRPADFLSWERVGDARISPDGQRILYTRSRVDPVEDRWRSAVWIMDADGGRKRQLVEGSRPRWSPDGERIAYVAEGENGRPQVFVKWLGEPGAGTQVTRLENPPSHLRWGPEGERLAFTSQVEDPPEFEGVEIPSPREGASWTEGPKVVERATYRRDGVGFVDETRTHVFVVPAEGGTARRLTQGDWDHRSPEWSAGGREIVFTSLREEEPDAPENWYESEIYAVDVESGDVRPLTTRRGPDEGAVPSPDGRLIAYTGVDWNRDAYRNQHVYVMNPDGSGVRRISGDFDRSPGRLMWAPDGSGVYFNAESEGARNLYLASLEGGVEQVTHGDEVWEVTSISRDGLAVATRSTPREPGDLYVYRLDRPGQQKRLTEVNADVLRDVELGEVEEIRYPSRGGLEIQGWIVKPPDFDPGEEHPLILAIHGGPHAMYDAGFDFRFQLHAARGYVVLYTNPRGSTGYGSEFADAIDHAYPGADYPDLMAGVDTVVNRGWADEENLFVYGCSGGGILTAEIVTRTGRFTAASSNCTIVDWISAMGTSDAYTYTRTFEERFWEDATEWIERSSIFEVENVTTPTLLMTGEKDLRTPVGQAEEFYRALKTRGVPAVMLRFRDEWHGTGSNPSNFLRTTAYLWKWFEKWGTVGG